MATAESLTAEEHQQAASSGKGNPPSAIDAYRASIRPQHMTGKGMCGPIAPRPYSPPLDLDPRNVDHLLPTNAKGDREHADVLAMTRSAFASSFAALEQISKAQKAAAANDAWTEAHALLQVGGMADKTLDRLTQAFDNAHKKLTELVAALDKSLSSPLEGGTRDQLAIEIREHVKNLPEAKRAAFVGEALKKNDTRTMQAILGAPAFLSGLGEAHHTLYTRQYREASNPTAVARLDVARKGLELLEARSGLILTEIEKAMGGSFKKLKKIREANSAAEAALVMQSGLE